MIFYAAGSKNVAFESEALLNTFQRLGKIRLVVEMKKRTEKEKAREKTGKLNLEKGNSKPEGSIYFAARDVLKRR